MPKRLETERLLLTPELKQDADWLAELLSARGQGSVSVQEAADRIAAMTETVQNLGIGALVLRVKPDNDPIGYCAVIVGRTTLEEPELAFELLPRAHGHGYATEAANCGRATGELSPTYRSEFSYSSQFCRSSRCASLNV
jgi:RimJ/RimL family protein N-acetyltransferase